MAEKAMTWLQLIKELDDVRSKARSGHNVVEQVNWEEPYIQNLLFVLTEHKVTPRVVPIKEEADPTIATRTVMLSGRPVQVKNGKGDDAPRVVPVPRVKDNTVNTVLDVIETDKDGKVLPKLDEKVWTEGDS